MNTEIQKTGGRIQNSNERMMRVLQATPEQLKAIDSVLEGKAGREAQRAPRSGPLTLMTKEAAEYLGVHRATIRRLVKAGRVRSVPLLGSERVVREDLEAIAFGNDERNGGEA